MNGLIILSTFFLKVISYACTTYLLHMFIKQGRVIYYLQFCIIVQVHTSYSIMQYSKSQSLHSESDISISGSLGGRGLLVASMYVQLGIGQLWRERERERERERDDVRCCPYWGYTTADMVVVCAGISQGLGSHAVVGYVNIPHSLFGTYFLSKTTTTATFHCHTCICTILYPELAQAALYCQTIIILRTMCKLSGRECMPQ